MGSSVTNNIEGEWVMQYQTWKHTKLACIEAERIEIVRKWLADGYNEEACEQGLWCQLGDRARSVITTAKRDLLKGEV